MALPVRLDDGEPQYNYFDHSCIPIDLLLKLSELAGNVGGMAIQHRGIS